MHIENHKKEKNDEHILRNIFFSVIQVKI